MQIQKLLYLSEENLRDRLFVKDIVHNFPQSEKILLLHEAFGEKVADTRFVTKRLSSYFSEQMVYNNAFSADQRNLISANSGGFQLNKELIYQLMEHIQLLILNPIISSENGPKLGSAQLIANFLRTQLTIEKLILFPENPLSPLATKQPTIMTEQDFAYWKPLYEEEEKTLRKALHLAPAQIVSPSTYGT